MPHLNRRDPAPSRLSYRLHRLWLTPLFRFFMRSGMPVIVVALAAWAYLANEERRDALMLSLSEIRQSIEDRPEFMVKLMAIDGASTELGQDIREVLPVDFPVSSFDLDLDEMHRTISGLDAVAKADLRVRPGGILQITVTEREPAIVWRVHDQLELLDATGHRVAPLETRGDRPDLPLIAGIGADRYVGEALELYAAAGPLQPRIRGLMRVGERRWTVVLDQNQMILLPEKGAVTALLRVEALHTAEDMLARDVRAVDMRQPGRPTLRLSQPAAQDLLYSRTPDGDTQG
ncbi:cell division protein FtsQ/DivIB [Actibacterium pelagium]|uniref:Cell division protein FtsQ n=1 Tax=Actibacterium pelagium TaxID=2029103 RepID=A0A917AF63_9RHOB|nr:cell division protein FtsQ/DivIB [Actibacterium pelagium]GGE47279.1 cell division protein FtsQ [Actibacterium pelagium]